MENEQQTLPGIEPVKAVADNAGTGQQPVSATGLPPMTDEAIVDLRLRVMKGEPVSDDELRHALRTLATRRANASAASAAAKSKGEVTLSPRGPISDRFKAFKEQQNQKATQTTT